MSQQISEQARYSSVAMAVHWLTALAIIGLLIIGNIMADYHPTDDAGKMLRLQMYTWHKSFGVAVFLLTLFRLAWRLSVRPPALSSEMPALEVRIAHLAHWALYGLLFLTPILGWVMVSASPRSIPTILFGLVELPRISLFADLDLQVKKDYKDLFEELHGNAAYLMAAIVVGHIGAALRHRLILKDKVAQRMLPKFIPALLLAALALPASASDWQVDATKSDLGFTGSVSGQKFNGHFKSWQAEIAFDPANVAAGHAKVVIDMASAATGDKQRDSALPSSDWFDVKKQPQAVFEASSFTAKGGNSFEAVGSLTIRGIKKPVTMPFTLDINGGLAHAKGQLDIVRTDFGVGQGDWSQGDTVGLAVSITFDLTAKPKG